MDVRFIFRLSSLERPIDRLQIHAYRFGWWWLKRLSSHLCFRQSLAPIQPSLPPRQKPPPHPPLSSPCRHYLLEAFIPFMNLVVRLVILFLGTCACFEFSGSAQQSSGRRSSCRSVKGFDRYELQRHPTYQCRLLPLNWVTLEFRGLHVKRYRSCVRPSQPGQRCIRSFGNSQRRADFRKRSPATLSIDILPGDVLLPMLWLSRRS